MRTQPRRRRFPHASSVALASAAAALLLGAASAAEDRFELADPSVVRPLTVGAVLTDDEATGPTVLDGIVSEFEAQTGYDVVVTQGDIDSFDQARFGRADIVMAHLGFTPLHDFVVNNLGETLFLQRILAAVVVRPKSTARSSGRRAIRMTTDRRTRIGR